MRSLFACSLISYMADEYTSWYFLVWWTFPSSNWGSAWNYRLLLPSSVAQLLAYLQLTGAESALLTFTYCDTLQAFSISSLPFDDPMIFLFLNTLLLSRLPMSNPSSSFPTSLNSSIQKRVSAIFQGWGQVPLLSFEKMRMLSAQTSKEPSLGKQTSSSLLRSKYLESLALPLIFLQWVGGSRGLMMIFSPSLSLSVTVSLIFWKQNRYLYSSCWEHHPCILQWMQYSMLTSSCIKLLPALTVISDQTTISSLLIIALNQSQKKSSIDSSMSAVILPSSRLAIYLPAQLKVKFTPTLAEEHIELKHQEQRDIALIQTKNMPVISLNSWLGPNPTSEPTRQYSFPKKLTGLTTDQNRTIYVSDKFGDIYSIEYGSEEYKFLNSNLAIPTFLKHVTVQNRHYLVVGDEDTRIKVFNPANMHELKAFWFLIKRVPVSMVQLQESKLVFLVRKQENYTYNEEEAEGDSFVELYEMDAKDIVNPEFTGRLFCRSHFKEGTEECIQQKVVGTQDAVYLLRLFSNQIRIKSWRLIHNELKQEQEVIVPINEGKWEHIDANIATSSARPQMVISYGRNYQPMPLDSDFQQPLEKRQSIMAVSLSQDEHLIVYDL